jgi:hypothetical protein
MIKLPFGWCLARQEDYYLNVRSLEISHDINANLHATVSRLNKRLAKLERPRDAKGRFVAKDKE